MTIKTVVLALALFFSAALDGVSPASAISPSCDRIWCGAACPNGDYRFCFFGAPPTSGCSHTSGGGCGSMDGTWCCSDSSLF